MEIKEAIKWFEWANDVYHCYLPNKKPDSDFYKQSKEISDLLKQLEAENKKYKTISHDLEEDLEEREKELTEEIEFWKWRYENKDTKNKAYKEMWDSLWETLEMCKIYNSEDIQTYAEVILPESEQKYLEANK